MSSQTFILPSGKPALLTFIDRLPMARKWKVIVGAYKQDRSVEQNAVCHGWYGKIARELKEDTPEGVKRWCKLNIGVPILRTDDADFSAFCDLALKRLSYEKQIEAMKYLDVTSLMSTSQMLEYMTTMQDTFAGRVKLVYPNDPPELAA